MRALDGALAHARAATVRRLATIRASPLGPCELGRVAEIAYAVKAGFAVWSCVPAWLRAAIHGGGNRTIRDRGVDAVGMSRDGRLVLVQVKWYRPGALISGDADMKLALIGAVARRSLRLADAPLLLLAFRRGARTARSSPGTESVRYVELTDAQLDLGCFVSASVGSRGLEYDADAGLDDEADEAESAAEVAEADDNPFETYRYKARSGRSETTSGPW